MKPGHESQTAVMVCAARAAAHGRTDVAAFSDPIAIELLPEEARQRVEQFRAGAQAKRLRERIQCVVLEKRTKMVVPRTVAIDGAIRDAASPQVVILGAGLDGRAWPSIIRHVAEFLLRLVGEPFLSAFTADEMRTLLAGFDFTVVQDDDLAKIATSLNEACHQTKLVRVQAVKVNDRFAGTQNLRQHFGLTMLPD
jgi:hypothetical protein